VASKLAFQFPGLGGYVPGILSALWAEHPAVREAMEPVDQAAREYGHRPVSPLLTEPDSPQIEELADMPALLNLATVGATLAVYAVLRAEGISPNVVLGHSTGELAALAVVGCLSVYDLARVICDREVALVQAGVTGGMVALNTDAQRARTLCGACGDWTLEVSLVNAPRQTVVSGSDRGVRITADLARAAGVLATRLPVGFPSHSPLLAPAAGILTRAVRSYPFHPPRDGSMFSPMLERFVTTAEDGRTWSRGSLSLRCTTCRRSGGCTAATVSTGSSKSVPAAW
jgi:acyl transferase domain-containing protein